MASNHNDIIKLVGRNQSDTNMLLSNTFLSLRLSLTLLSATGFWPEPNLVGVRKYISRFYSFAMLIFLAGIYVIAQAGELIQVLGDVALMTSASFLLGTNMALVSKMLNVVGRRARIGGIVRGCDDELGIEDDREGKEIVKRCDREASRLLYWYIFLSFATVLGWAVSAERHKLPQRAWYPYDTSKTPAYELTYAHQIIAVFIAAAVNISLDTVFTSLMAQCNCRLQLLGLSLRNLFQNLEITRKITPEEEKTIIPRLHRCITRHQSILMAVNEIQDSFSEPIMIQTGVSMLIICITAYQLAFETSNPVRLISMVAYLMCMMLQIFLYCYQGNQLSDESSKVASAAYECPWYVCSPQFRRSLLTLMTRSQKIAQLTVAGFSTLSLASFMSIIKASYSLFSVLQRVKDEN